MKTTSKIVPSFLAQHAIKAALCGARVARAAQLAGLHPSSKSEEQDDLVTEGDEASQQAILDILPRTLDLPEGAAPASVLAEEKMVPVTDHCARWRWVIDPIDGTLPYSKGEAFWCVSIALQEQEAEVWISRIGVVYQADGEDTQDRLYGKLFWAEGNAGAYLDDLKTSLQSRVSKPATIFPEAEIDAGGAFGTWAHAEFARLGIATRFRRSICHAVTEMLLGRKCAVVQDAGPLEWDVAAIMLIARHAGAHVMVQQTDEVAGCNRYAAVLAWDKPLFKLFSERLPAA